MITNQMRFKIMGAHRQLVASVAQAIADLERAINESNDFQEIEECSSQLIISEGALKTFERHVTEFHGVPRSTFATPDMAVTARQVKSPPTKNPAPTRAPQRPAPPSDEELAQAERAASGALRAHMAKQARDARRSEEESATQVPLAKAAAAASAKKPSSKKSTRGNTGKGSK